MQVSILLHQVLVSTRSLTGVLLFFRLCDICLTCSALTVTSCLPLLLPSFPTHARCIKKEVEPDIHIFPHLIACRLWLHTARNYLKLPSTLRSTNTTTGKPNTSIDQPNLSPETGYTNLVTTITPWAEWRPSGHHECSMARQATLTLLVSHMLSLPYCTRSFWHLSSHFCTDVEMHSAYK